MFTLPALLQPLCTQFGCTVAVAFVTLLACSCKLLHCGVPGCSDCSVAVVYFHGGINTYVLLYTLEKLGCPRNSQGCTCTQEHLTQLFQSVLCRFLPLNQCYNLYICTADPSSSIFSNIDKHHFRNLKLLYF